MNESQNQSLKRVQKEDLFSDGPVLTIVWSPEEHWPVQYVSRNLHNILGYKPEEWTNTNFHYADLIHPDDLASVGTEVQAHMHKKQDRFSQEYRLRHKDGHYVYMYDFTQFIRDNQKEVVEIRGYMFDQSERKLAETEVHKLSVAITQSPATVVITDLQGNIEYVNPMFTKTTGYTVEEALGQNPRILKSGEMAPEAYQEMWGTLLLGQTWHGEFHNKRKDGSLYWEAASIPPVIDNSGQITNYLAVKENISARKTMERQLRESNAALEQASARAQELAAHATRANAAKSDFLANMSHEIRTPMNGVTGMLSLLLDTNLDDEQRRFAETAQASGEALLSLINDILDFSKIEAGKLSLEEIDFDLRSLLDDFADSMSLSFAQKRLVFICHADPDVPSMLRGDPGRLRQVLTNLVGNAIKFTEKGEVELRVRLLNSHESNDVKKVKLHFGVRDTGIGIPQNKIDKLFEKFTQADNSTTRKFGGTGLGLAISKQLANLMGGESGATSQLNTGSEFWFTGHFKQSQQEAAPLLPIASLREKSVVIVDSNTSNRRAMRRQLESWAMRVEEAEDIDSLERICIDNNQAHADVVLFDTNLIGSNRAPLKQVIEGHPTTKWLALATVGLRGDAQRMSDLGFAAYLSKPVRHDELYRVLVQILDPAVMMHDSGISTRHSSREQWRIKVNKNARILLAEDNKTNQMVALGMLKKFGLTAQVVTTGKEAIEALQKQAFDLVFMDVQMPEMDGLQATRAWRKQEQREQRTATPIIAMTAHAMRGDRERCETAGMDDYISKPIEPRALSEALSRWISDNDVPAPAEHNPDKNHSKDAAIPAEFMQLAVLDTQTLHERLLGDSELVQAVAETFIEEMPKQIQELKQNLGKQNCMESERLSHSIKGACANVSAEAMRAVAAEMEQLSKNRKLDLTATHLPALDSAFNHVQQALKELIKQG